jgi:hypothetical protein
MPFPGSPVAAVSKAASGSLCYPRPVLVFLIALYVRWMFRSTLGPVQRVTAVTAIPPATPGFAERPDFGARDLWKAVLHEGGGPLGDPVRPRRLPRSKRHIFNYLNGSNWEAHQKKSLTL